MIPIPQKFHLNKSAIGLEELLSNYFSVEIIEDYKCESCLKKSKFEKNTKISKFPETLIFVFNVFNVMGQDFIQKLQKSIEIPLYDLNLSKFEARGLENKKNSNFNLDSFICHYGESVDFGHYIRFFFFKKKKNYFFIYLIFFLLVFAKINKKIYGLNSMMRTFKK